MYGVRHGGRMLLAAIALAWCISPALAQRYRPIDLGTLGGNYSRTRGVNASGQVVGGARVPGNSMHPFFFTGAALLDLGTLGGTSGEAMGLNDAGAAVGSAGTTRFSHAFLWTAAVGLTDLGTLGGSTSCANAVNSAGAIVGRAALAGDSVVLAFVRSAAGQMTSLGLLPDGSFSNATGINDLGVVCGIANTWSALWGMWPNRAFRWDAASGMRDLGTLGGPGSYAYGINRSGLIVGESETASGDSHAFVWSGGRMKDLGVLEKGRYLYSAAYALNDQGYVVGYSDMKNGGTHAFLYNGRRLVDLNATLTETVGWEINYAYGISNTGYIAAWGRTPTSSGLASRAILLVPVP